MKDWDIIVRLVYLWTRDAEMPVDEETAGYVRDHLAGLHLTPIYSDQARADMARKLVEEACRA